jgi:hypothetical protein
MLLHNSFPLKQIRGSHDDEIISTEERISNYFIFLVFLYVGWSKEQLEGLFDAVADLKLSLQTRGSDLVIVTGSTKDILFTLAQKVRLALEKNS